MLKILIYRIYFPTSDKCYIGQTTNIERRMMDHVKGRFKSAIHNALMKYDVWKVLVLHTCHSVDEANRVEIEEIRNFNSITPNGYNLTRGGESVIGLKWTDEQRARASAAHKGRQTGADNPMFGKKRPDLTARNKTAENLARLDKARRQPKPYLIERNKSKEMRAKVRASKLGKKRGPQTKEWTARRALSHRSNNIVRLEAELRETLGDDWEKLISEV